MVRQVYTGGTILGGISAREGPSISESFNAGTAARLAQTESRARTAEAAQLARLREIELQWKTQDRAAAEAERKAAAGRATANANAANANAAAMRAGGVPPAPRLPGAGASLSLPAAVAPPPPPAAVAPSSPSAAGVPLSFGAGALFPSAAGVPLSFGPKGAPPPAGLDVTGQLVTPVSPLPRAGLDVAGLGMGRRPVTPVSPLPRAGLDVAGLPPAPAAASVEDTPGLFASFLNSISMSAEAGTLPDAATLAAAERLSAAAWGATVPSDEAAARARAWVDSLPTEGRNFAEVVQESLAVVRISQGIETAFAAAGTAAAVSKKTKSIAATVIAAQRAGSGRGAEHAKWREGQIADYNADAGRNTRARAVDAATQATAASVMGISADAERGSAAAAPVMAGLGDARRREGQIADYNADADQRSAIAATTGANFYHLSPAPNRSGAGSPVSPEYGPTTTIGGRIAASTKPFRDALRWAAGAGVGALEIIGGTVSGAGTGILGGLIAAAGYTETADSLLDTAAAELGDIPRVIRESLDGTLPGETPPVARETPPTTEFGKLLAEFNDPKTTEPRKRALRDWFDNIQKRPAPPAAGVIPPVAGLTLSGDLADVALTLQLRGGSDYIREVVADAGAGELPRARAANRGGRPESAIYNIGELRGAREKLTVEFSSSATPQDRLYAILDEVAQIDGQMMVEFAAWGLRDAQVRGDTSMVSAMLTDQVGFTVDVQAMNDGTFDIYIDGQLRLDGTGVSYADLEALVRTPLDEEYAAARVAMAAEAAEVAKGRAAENRKFDAEQSAADAAADRTLAHDMTIAQYNEDIKDPSVLVEESANDPGVLLRYVEGDLVGFYQWSEMVMENGKSVPVLSYTPAPAAGAGGS